MAMTPDQIRAALTDEVLQAATDKAGNASLYARHDRAQQAYIAALRNAILAALPVEAEPATLTGDFPIVLKPVEAEPPTCATWQPIATLQPDEKGLLLSGARVLLFGPDGITTGHYDGVKGHEDTFPFGWRGHHEPTHWMPLPAPPTEDR